MIFKKERDTILGKHDFLYKVYTSVVGPFLLRALTVRAKRLQANLLKTNNNSRYEMLTVDRSLCLNIDLYRRTDLEMLREIVSTGFYERATTRLIKSILKPGATFVDVGANVGYYSILGSQLVGETGKVFSFEPVPDTIDRLNTNIRLNQANNVVVVPKAAFSSDGSRTLYFSDVQDGMNSLLKEIRHNRNQKVETIRLDSLLGDQTIALLKIDVEGAERDVLLGAKRTVASSGCKVIVEWNKFSHFTSKDLDDRFDCYKSVGTIYIIADSPDAQSYLLNGPISERRELPPGCNLLLIPRRANRANPSTA